MSTVVVYIPWGLIKVHTMLLPMDVVFPSLQMHAQRICKGPGQCDIVSLDTHVLQK